MLQLAPSTERPITDNCRVPPGASATLSGELERKRDVLAEGLTRIGFDVLPTGGAYFLCADFRRFSKEDDASFCRRLTEEAGVTVIPVSAFYEKDGPSHLIRFAFCKRDEVIAEALTRLERYFAQGRRSA